MSSTQTAGPDTLVLDVPAAHQLARAMSIAVEDLFSDQLALRGLLDEATALLRVDRTGALVPLASARRGFERISSDLRWRLDLIDRTQVALAGIDDLSSEISDWHGRLLDPELAVLHGRRRRAILDLVEGDAEHARRVEAAIASGMSALDAFQGVHAALRLEARVESLTTAFGIDEPAALAMIARVDRNLAALSALGIGDDEALSAVAIVENFGLDLDVALVHAADAQVGLLESLGRLLTARGLGVTLGEYGALKGLETHFAAFDNATGGDPDQRVSVGDLAYVVSHPWAFTPSQVLAAQALIEEPLLRNRLDTAEANTDVFGGDGFGSAERGDGLIADVDLRAFMLKAQIHRLLGDYADEIDVANDPTGVVDGFRSQNDFLAFIADNPELPEPVLAAAEVALEAGWFDESWWQEHKDELAMGAALLAAGIAVVATGGGASMLLVVGVGAFAAGGTTVAVNLATGAPMLDDVFMNSVKGGFIAAGVHGVATGFAGYATATTGLGRVAAVAGVTSGAADVVAAGGVDLLLAEEDEARIHEVANEISTITGAVDLAHGAGEWTMRRPATFETVDDQLAALSSTLSRQKQLRHLDGSPIQAEGGYLFDLHDGQRVIDAVHDGSAPIVGRATSGHLIVEYPAVSGMHVNAGVGQPGVVTSTFLIKGTSSPSVVPARPGRTD